MHNNVVFFLEDNFISKNIGELIESVSDSANTSIRTMFANIDAAIYNFYSSVLQLFFDVAKSKFLSGTIYVAIFRRVFLILGIFMLFKLMISFLQYLISPDMLQDKERGVGKLIGRIITTIIFLYVLMPFNASDKVDTTNDAYGSNIREQGILFGTLQTVQNSILENQVISQLILGPSVVKHNDSDMIKTTTDNTKMAVFSSFYSLNVDVLSDPTSTGQYQCMNQDQDAVLAGVAESDVTIQGDNGRVILSDMGQVQKSVNYVCYAENGDYGYMFNYQFFISTLVGLVLVVLTFLFTFDVALRSIKLGLLRLISPIPAMSYIDPKSSKDGMFANYTKTLISTYLDLFLRIAIIYIVILLIDQLVNNTNEIIQSDNPIAWVIIIITLLFFAFQAPRFIKQALGIKDTGTGFGFGAALLGGALAGGISGLATGGIWGGIKGLAGGANAGAQNQWAAQSGQRPNMSARQAALNRGAQLGSGDPNAKGMGAMSMLGGMIGNGIAGTTKRRIDRQKALMYQEQEDAARLNRIAEDLRNGNYNPNTLAQSDQDFLRAKGLGATNANGNFEIKRDATHYAVNVADAAAFLSQTAYGLQSSAGKREGDIGDAKKEWGARNPKSMRRKFRARDRFGK